MLYAYVTGLFQFDVYDKFYFDSIDRGSLLYLWTVNANEIGKAVTEMTINCVGFSCAPEGISVNVVAAGLDYGVIR